MAGDCTTWKPAATEAEAVPAVAADAMRVVTTAAAAGDRPNASDRKFDVAAAELCDATGVVGGGGVGNCGGDCGGAGGDGGCGEGESAAVELVFVWPPPQTQQIARESSVRQV